MYKKRERWRRAILLVDINAFFAQVEQRHIPLLRGKPVLVVGSSFARTVVTASSYEAKAHGVQSGMSLYQARQLCPEAIVVEGNPDKYLSLSRQLLSIYRSFTDLVEAYSIDEAFLDVTGVQLLFGSPEEIVRSIKAEMRRKLGLTCSIGIAPNKLMAKMASNMQKPDGLTVLPPEKVPQAMWHLPVEKLFGVGYRLKVRLHQMGVHTIGDLAVCPEEVLQWKFGKYGQLLHRFAHGIDPSPVEPELTSQPQSVGHAYTLPEDCRDRATVRFLLFTLADKVARRLRQQQLVGRTITLTVRTADYLSFTRSRTFPLPLVLPQEVASAAEKLFQIHFAQRTVRMLGITISQLQPTFPLQPSLYEKRLRFHKALSAMDKIKERYGEEAMTFASLTEPQRSRLLCKKVGCFMTHEEKRESIH